MTTQLEAWRLVNELVLHARHAMNGEAFNAAIAAAAELRRLHGVNKELLAALEKLARLGNGDHYGNSEGNTIARAAIAKAEGEAMLKAREAK